MKARQLSFFDEAKKYEKITKLGDPLEKLDSVMVYIPPTLPQLHGYFATSRR